MVRGMSLGTLVPLIAMGQGVNATVCENIVADHLFMSTVSHILMDPSSMSMNEKSRQPGFMNLTMSSVDFSGLSFPHIYTQ